MASISFVEGSWRALIRRKGHKDISKRFDTKGKAAAWARDIEGQIISGMLAPTVASKETVGQLVTRYRNLRAQIRPILDISNEHYVLKQLTKNLGHLVAAHMTVADLLGWAQQRRDEGAGPYTINCDLSKLGTVLRYTGDGLPDVIGAARPKLSHFGLIGGGGLRERRPTEDESTRVLAWLAEHKGQVYADFALFAAITAMRRGEVARILWADVDEVKKMVLVRDRKDPRAKVGNDQWVPLLGESWAVLQRQPKGERVFTVHPQTMTSYFTEACKALAIPDLHLHDLRHDGISAMFEQGFDIPHVAVVSGHKDWRHLKRYTNIKPESLHDHLPRPGTPPGPGNPRSASPRPRKS